IGMMVNPTDKIRLGLNYRSEIIMEARGGDATYNDVPNIPAMQALLQDTQFDADLPLPAEVTTGLSIQFTDKWLVAFDYNYTIWSAYKSLYIEFTSGSSSSNPSNYKKSSPNRVGTQYKANYKYTFRSRYYFHESPEQDWYFAPETPRKDSNAFTGG